MMEIGLAQRVRERPIGFGAVGLLDHRGEAHSPGLTGCKARVLQIDAQRIAEARPGIVGVRHRQQPAYRFLVHAQLGEMGRHAGPELLGVRRGDPWRRDLHLAHPGAIAIEPIGGPFARGGEVELGIAARFGIEQEHFEAGTLPQPVRPRRLRHRREMQRFRRRGDHEVDVPMPGVLPRQRTGDSFDGA